MQIINLFLLMFFSLASFQSFSFEPHLIILRHGQAQHNVWGLYNSNPDHPNYRPSHLTRKGKAQVRKAALRLRQAGLNHHNIAQVFVSPLPRTHETAFILSQYQVTKAALLIDPRLSEMKAGDREGTLRLRYLLSRTRSQEDPHSYGGETYEDLTKRVQSFLSDLSLGDGKGHILVITHQAAAEKMAALCGVQESFSPAHFITIPLQSVKRHYSTLP